MPSIHHTTFIHMPIEVCFNLARTIEVRSGKFLLSSQKAIEGVTSGLMANQDTVTWEIEHLGMKQQLTSQIIQMEAPYRFVDEMTHGVFQSFTHLHEFRSIKGGTRMDDIFTYAAPFGVLGAIANKLFLKKYMKNFIIQQAENLKVIAEC